MATSRLASEKLTCPLLSLILLKISSDKTTAKPVRLKSWLKLPPIS